MSATYGTLRSDVTDTTVTKRGNGYVEMTAQTEEVRCIVTLWANGRIDVETRATLDRHDSGVVVGRMTRYSDGSFEVFDV